ncbi:MAG TPA: hypothetical protein VFS16_12885, partial [Acidimicrobiia bacterium]|nr:hypothetical protein [Acidimicrobiia bacterium]
FPDDFAGVTDGSATPVSASPRGGDTYLGPAGTAANQAMAGATPTVATVQEETAKLDLSGVPVGLPVSPYRRSLFGPS